MMRVVVVWRLRLWGRAKRQSSQSLRTGCLGRCRGRPIKRRVGNCRNETRARATRVWVHFKGNVDVLDFFVAGGLLEVGQV